MSSSIADQDCTICANCQAYNRETRSSLTIEAYGAFFEPEHISSDSALHILSEMYPSEEDHPLPAKITVTVAQARLGFVIEVMYDFTDDDIVAIATLQVYNRVAKKEKRLETMLQIFSTT